MTISNWMTMTCVTTVLKHSFLSVAGNSAISLGAQLPIIVKIEESGNELPITTQLEAGHRLVRITCTR